MHLARDKTRGKQKYSLSAVLHKNLGTMINELTNDYSSYLKLDISKEINSLEETIEDMLTRLEEFEGLVDMVRSDGTQCLEGTTPMVYSCHKELQNLFDRIDHLESFVGRVKHDLDVVEHHLDAAEADVGSESGLKNILKPLFFKKQDPAAGSRKVKSPTYEAPPIFSTSEFFITQDDSKKQEE